MTSGTFSIRADFLECQGRKLFYLLLQPTQLEARGSVLYLPPFTEEMHKSRHIVASQARHMASRGYNVLLLDLTGCGDSEGEFSEASWQVWLQDANAAADTVAALGPGPIVVWAQRMGALLACELARGRNDVARMIFWQPVLNGEQQIDQFLRLRTVPLASHARDSFDRSMLWGELRAGRALEIAGYELSPAMALAFARERLNDICPPCPVYWLEISARADQGVSVASGNVVRNWRAQGGWVEALTVIGEPFWRNPECSINPELQRLTLELLER